MCVCVCEREREREGERERERKSVLAGKNKIGIPIWLIYSEVC